MDRESGIWPINWLFDRSRRVNLSDDKLVGISPESSLLDKFKELRLGKCPRLAGMLLESLLPDRFISLRETHEPNESGI